MFRVTYSVYPFNEKIMLFIYLFNRYNILVFQCRAFIRVRRLWGFMGKKIQSENRYLRASCISC